MSLLGKRFIGFTVCVCVWGVYHLYGPVEASVVFSLKEIQVLNSQSTDFYILCVAVLLGS